MDLYNQIVERLRIAGVKFSETEWLGGGEGARGGEAEVSHAGFCWSWDPQNKLGIYAFSVDATAQDVERLLGWFLAQAARP